MKRQPGNDLSTRARRRTARVVADLLAATAVYEQLTGGRWQALAERWQREAGDEDTVPSGWRVEGEPR